MTDRLEGVMVTFDKPTRDDDSEWIINSIRMIKGVRDVRPVVQDVGSMLVAVRVKSEVRDKLYDFIREELA